MNLIREQKEFYERPRTLEEIGKWQLERFNQLWPDICQTSPYFRKLKNEKKLPARFSSWQGFQERVPTLERRDLQENRHLLVNEKKPPDSWRTTGGSTGEPVQTPAWNSEKEYARKDLWYARSWFGVERHDRLFLIWGHSHLLGKGVRGWVNRIERNLKDRLLGYHRYSAYDLSEEGLRRAARELLDFKPRYLLGYSAALDRFARVNQDLAPEFHKLHLKVIITTAESFPKPESRGLICQVLGSPVAMEYGAVETGPMAHERPEGGYTVFWRHFFWEGRAFDPIPGTYEVLVTSLYPRSFPLVRYRVGDLFTSSSRGDFGLTFESIVGRSNDEVRLGGEIRIHSEAFAHAVKEISSIAGYQVQQSSDGAVTLNYLSDTPLALEEIKEIRRRLRRIDSRLEHISIRQVASFEQTLAGKTRRILASR